MILENVCFGVAIIMYNSQMPFLLKCHPEVRKLIDGGKAKASEIVTKYDELSLEAIVGCVRCILYSFRWFSLFWLRHSTYFFSRQGV